MGGCSREVRSGLFSAVVRNTFGGHRIVIFSSSKANTTAAVLEEVAELAKGGASGSTMGRNAFRRPKKDAVKLLHDVMDIFAKA